MGKLQDTQQSSCDEINIYFRRNLQELPTKLPCFMLSFARKTNGFSFWSRWTVCFIPFYTGRPRLGLRPRLQPNDELLLCI
jgi:hypothetical protein